MSIDDCFATAPYVNRIPIEGLEFKWHPGSTKPGFHGSGNGPFIYTSGSTTGIAAATDASGVGSMCVIAWRNANTSQRIELTKIVEWKPEANVGIVQQTPVALQPETSYLDAVRLLDNEDPHWWSGYMRDMLARAGRSAMTGVRAALQHMVLAGGGMRQVRQQRLRLEL